MLKNRKLKIFFLPVVTAIIFVIVYRVWIFSGGYLTSGDWPFYYQAFLRHFWGWPQIWEAFTNTGSVDLVPAFDIFKALYSALSFFVDYSLSSRILYFWPIIIFTPLFSYICLSHFLKNKYAVFVGIVVFSFNTYNLLLGTGDLTLMASFSMLPLLFFLFKQTLEKLEFKYVLFTTLGLFVSSIYEPRVTYIIVWVLFFYFIYSSFLIDKIKNKKEGTLRITYAILPIILTGFLSLYWVLPLVHLGTLTNNDLFSRNLFGNEFLNILYAVTLFHPFWTGTVPSVFIVQQIPPYFWLIPFFSFLGLFLNRKNRIVLFFGILSLIGIFLTKQSAYPFAGVYLWLYTHIPGFNAFREASKFYPIIAFSYSFLIAFFIQWLWENWKQARWKIYGKYFLTFLIIGIFLWNTKPFITGEIGTLFVTRKIPSDYLVAEKYILEQPTYFRTYWIPTFSRWSPYSNLHPEISAISEEAPLWKNFVKNIGSTKKYSEAELVVKFLQSSKADKLLDDSSIKYVIIPLKDKANDDLFKNYGKERKYYTEAINTTPYLKKVNIGTKELAVYENTGFKSHIYITQANRDASSQSLQYTSVSSGEYKVYLRHIKQQFTLHFSETYSPKWKIRIGVFHWWDSLIRRNYFLSDNYHTPTDVMLNTFQIDPKIVCRQSMCQKNADGSYDISMTLYFAPQAYLNAGLIISIVTFMGIMACFAFMGIRRNIR